MAKFEFQVVLSDGEQLFQGGDLFFDSLRAMYEFDGGSLSVIRGGQLLDKTSSITEVGTHAACMFFLGFKNFYLDGYPSGGTPILIAKDFNVGDSFVLDVRGPFDFAKYLKTLSAKFSVVRDLFDEKEEWGVGELQETARERMAGAIKEVDSLRVIRFIRGPRVEN